MKKLALLILIPIALFFVFKPTVNKENNRWASSIEKIQTLSIQYPQFATFLNEELKEAKAHKESGDASSDEDQKLKLYQYANEKLSNGVFQKLSSVISDEEKINELISNYKADKARYEENERIIPLFENALEAQDICVNVTKQRSYDNRQDAFKALEIASSKMSSAISSLEKLMASINKKDAEKYKDGDDNIPEQVKEAKAAASPQQYTCEYCGSTFTGSNCKSCGAGREAYDGTN